MLLPSVDSALGVLSVLLSHLGLSSSSSNTPNSHPGRQPTARELGCEPFLPKLFSHSPPARDHPLITGAAARAALYLEQQIAEHAIDGLSVGVVSTRGPLFERNWGVQRANESETSPAMTSHSQYRLASVSKLLLTFEGWQLAQRGVISWDDPVSKHLPSFRPNFASYLPTNTSHREHEDQPEVSLRDLASHLSGLGRDWPPGTTSHFPEDTSGAGPPPENGLPFPTHDAVYASVARHNLAFPPAFWPSYSNTGLGVLGMALVAANRNASAHPEREPASVAALMERDVFGPLGMKGSHYAMTPQNRADIVVGKDVPELADMDFLDAMNPSGGQFSSLSDLMSFSQALLAPGALAQSSLNRWFRPLHAFEEDDWTESGLVWEIVKHVDSHGRRRRIYWKLGELPGYHSAVAVHPGTSYAVVVLLSASWSDAAELAYSLFDIFQPAIDGALAELADVLYAGRWASEDGSSYATVEVVEGTLWLREYVLDGKEVLTRIWGADKKKGLALRDTGRRDELRIDTGLVGRNGQRTMGCQAYWVTVDDWGMRKGAPVNLITFTGEGEGRRLHAPAAGITLSKRP